MSVYAVCNKKSVPLNKIENKEQGDGGTNEPTSFWFWVLRSALKIGGKIVQYQ